MRGFMQSVNVDAQGKAGRVRGSQPITGRKSVKRLFALLVGTAFVAGTVGFAVAGTATTTTDKKPAAADTKMDKKDTSAKKTKTATGTVKSASPDSIVVAGKDKGKDAEWTFALDDKTKVKKGGKDSMAKDLAAGDKVTVRYMDHDGKATAMNVNASAPKKAAETKPAEKK
jgi:hypothetical protein